MKFSVVSQSDKQHSLHKSASLQGAVTWGMTNHLSKAGAAPGLDWAVRNTEVDRQVFPPVIGVTLPEDLI